MGVSEINKIKCDLKHYLNITINEIKHDFKHESIMCKVEFNIHGGNNLIAPNSTNATQTIYANADNKANQYEQAEVVSPPSRCRRRDTGRTSPTLYKYR